MPASLSFSFGDFVTSLTALSLPQILLDEIADRLMKNKDYRRK
jgi:hypothetical protein